MRLGGQPVEADTVSRAWLDTVRTVAHTGGRVFHQITRITQPMREDADLRAVADAVLAECGFASVETVANTIFPAAMAARSENPTALCDRYREIYPVLRRFPGNKQGTYFGRIVDFPTPSGSEDQLMRLITKLQAEVATARPKSARYEVAVDTVGDASQGAEPAVPPAPESTSSACVHLHATGVDRIPNQFPCLSMCSFQLDAGHLHLIAHYRSQYLIQRGYGNYLGLGRLLGYVCQVVGLNAGELMIVAGYAQVDGRRRTVSSLINAASGISVRTR